MNADEHLTLLTEIEVLKDLANGLAAELVKVRADKKDQWKELIETKLLLDSTQKINNGRRATIDDLESLVNGLKEEVIEVTALNVSLGQADEAKLKFIHDHMGPLKDKLKAAVGVISRFEQAITINVGATTWSRTEIINLMNTIQKEWNYEND